jgi:hypothetical protein
VSPVAPLPQQSAVVTFRQDHAAGQITLQAIHGPFSFSLNGHSSTFSVPLVDAGTATQYGLGAFTATSLTIVSIDPLNTVLTATIGPAQ